MVSPIPMSDRPPNPRWLTVALAATAFAWTATCAVYVAAAILGDPIPPSPIAVLISVGLATITLGLILVRIDIRISAFARARESGDSLLGPYERGYADGLARTPLDGQGTVIQMPGRN